MSTQTGQTFGRFHILEELVSGQAARVYRAYDPARDRQLTLTVLPVRPANDGGDPKAVLQRARKLLELKHPHIVRIEDAGLAADSLYLESPLVEATSLAERLSQGPLGLPEAARYFEQIVSALELAHSRGLFHLALRPEHVLIDSYGNAMVRSFGLALLEGERGAQAQSPLSRNELHRAPEQDRGVMSDARADQFALGALLFRMLTGYMTSNPGMPVSELIRRMNERTARLATGPRPIPQAIAAVIVKASSWDPNDRYKSLAELHQAFRLAAASILETRSRLRSEEAQPPAEAPLSPPPRTRANASFWARPRARIGVAAVLLAFVLGGYGLVSAGALKPFGTPAAETEAVPLIDGGQLTAMAGTIEALSTQVQGAAPGATPTLAVTDEQPAVLALTGSPTAGPLEQTLEAGPSPTGPATAPVLETPGPGPTETPAANPGGATQPPPAGTAPPAGPTKTSLPPTDLPPPTNPPPSNTPPPPATNTPPPPPTATPAPTNTSPPPPTNTPIIPLPTVTLPLP